ncbi:MAG: hypothetical protein LH645_12890 [Actinomycetia bacterium]|nr:hypothetical protein [Actinomycetes bacterium]
MSKRWGSFNVGGGAGRPGMSAVRIQRFLDQFPERLVVPMLDKLEALTFLTRADLGERLAGTLNFDTVESVNVAPLI